MIRVHRGDEPEVLREQRQWRAARIWLERLDDPKAKLEGQKDGCSRRKRPNIVVPGSD